MNNVKSNNVKANKNSNLPLLIIGAVLLATIVGGWYFYSNSKSKPVKSNTNSANRKTDDSAALNLYNKAPLGAQPANLLGSPSATVTVEEFADYQCPTCATVHGKMKEINALYGSRIKFVYRNYPLTQIHKNAYDAAVAAEAAGLQGKFWDMQNQLFTNQQSWANSSEARKSFDEYAQKIGLDVAKFQNDMLGLATKSRVDADIQRGRALGISGTPSIFINGKPLVLEQFDVNPIRQVIDAELQKAGSAQPQQNQTANPSQPANSAANKATNSTTVK